MNAYKVTMKEEMAMRYWQNVISFGTDNYAEPKTMDQQDQKQVTFEVLP